MKLGRVWCMVLVQGLFAGGQSGLNSYMPGTSDLHDVRPARCETAARIMRMTAALRTLQRYFQLRVAKERPA